MIELTINQDTIMFCLIGYFVGTLLTQVYGAYDYEVIQMGFIGALLGLIANILFTL